MLLDLPHDRRDDRRHRLSRALDAPQVEEALTMPHDQRDRTAPYLVVPGPHRSRDHYAAVRWRPNR